MFRIAPLTMAYYAVPLRPLARVLAEQRGSVRHVHATPGVHCAPETSAAATKPQQNSIASSLSAWMAKLLSDNQFTSVRKAFLGWSEAL